MRLTTAPFENKHVAAAAEVIEVAGRTITFRVEARDERETIGGGIRIGFR